MDTPADYISVHVLSILWLVLFCGQYRADYGNHWSGAYYGGQMYGGYGYALPLPYDPPTMYAAAYGAYPMYGTHQQQVNWWLEGRENNL